MRVALVHDWLVINAGAEKVLRALLDIYPDADVFSLVDFLNAKDRADVLNGKHAKSTFLQYLPFAKKHFRKYLFLFPKAIKSLNLAAYDVVISSSWAVAKGIKKNQNQLHVSYYQARNMKYIWEEEKLYFKGSKKYIKPFIIDYLRNFDIKSSKNADYIITNSSFVQKWVQKRYSRESKIIYPPVATEKFTLCEEKEDYYLTAARFAPYKKIKLIVEAFNQMPHKRLILIGDGEEYAEIKALAKSNINLLGYKNTQELVPYMQKAKAFVYAAIEDFGIVPIEAMACGTPVIALNKGGTAETVIDGVNGLHFENQTTEEIIEAIQYFEKCSFNAREISQYAQSFSTQRFQKEIGDFLQECQSLKYNLT
jgi:glycosyltransferase involved in cell wall biosynthesis